MAPPAASSEGIAAQSDLGDTDDTSSSFLEPAIDMDRIKPRREMLSHAARSALEPRREALSKGGLAGVVIGIILIIALAFLCAYPFVIRRLRKGKRNAAANRLDTETAFAPGPVGPPGHAPPTGPGASSQMSSKDSFGHKTDPLRGAERQSTKEMTISSQNGVDQPPSFDMASQQQRNYTGDGSTQPPSVTTRRGTEQSFGIDRATTWKSEASFRWTPPGVELIPTRADGMDYSDASHGHSATYYSPTIPSEAFGMVTPPPTDEPQTRAPPRRSSSRGSSLKLNLFGMLRRMSTKDSVSTRTKGYPGQPPQGVLREGLSDSPTEFNPPSRELGPQNLASPITMPSPVSEGEAEQAREPEVKKPAKQTESPPIMPPVVPPFGTVNPMDIMAPSNATEQTWRTNQQLYQMAHPTPQVTATAEKQTEEQQPTQAPSPLDINLPSSVTEQTNHQVYQLPNPPNGPINTIQKQPTEPQPSQAPTPQSPEQPFEYQQQALRQRQEQERQQQQMYQQYEQQQQILQQQQQQQQWQQAGLVNGTPISYTNGYSGANNHNPSNTTHAVGQDARMHDVSPRVDPTHLMPDRSNHRYSLEGEMTDPSDHSPQMPGHASSGASYQTTPNTQIDSSPSPRSDGSSDIRNSTSPYPGFQQSPRSFMCDECGRFFDQVHKLNHHKRYHERPHECAHPGCGKRFGTKTHLDRHINDKHKKTKKFHCTVSTCPYSKAGGKSFPRKDNWRRHMVNIHQVTPIGEPEPDLVDEVMGGT